MGGWVLLARGRWCGCETSEARDTNAVDAARVSVKRPVVSQASSIAQACRRTDAARGVRGGEHHEPVAVGYGKGEPS